MTEQERMICAGTGFERCHFEPDESECELCGLPNLQLYYRRTCIDVDEGEYKCLCCVAVGKVNEESEGFCYEYEYKLAKLQKLCIDAGEAIHDLNGEEEISRYGQIAVKCLAVGEEK